MTRPRIAIPAPTSTDPEYNRRSWQQYADAVVRSGGEAVAIPLNAAPGETAKLIAQCSGVLLPGSGADVNPQKYGQEAIEECAAPDPGREAVDELLLQDAHNMGKPLLGICFGTQMLNVWRGGTLVQHLAGGPVNHAVGRKMQVAHGVTVADGSLLGEIIGEQEVVRQHDAARVEVNSSHHQAIEVPGDGLRISARSVEDGVVEAVEGGQASAAGGHFVVGVQWHPERTFESSAASRALFARLIAEAAAWVPRPATTSAA